MAKRSATELFDRYYTALVFSLPIKDPDFMDELLKHGLLCADVKSKLESITVHSERSSYFLDNVIKPGLAVSKSRCFVSLLTVMKCNKHDNVKDLAILIEKELIVDMKYSSKPLLKDLYNIVIPKVANDWYDIAIQLFNESQLPRLDEIRSTYSSNRREGCVEMLKHWLKITPGATWDNLIHALRTPGLELLTIADDVEKEVKNLFDVTKDQTDSVDISKYSKVMMTQQMDREPQLQTVPESVPVKFSVDQGMEKAFQALLRKFIHELKRPSPYGLDFDELRGSCINYCESHHHGTDFTDSVSSMSDLISKLSNPKYCNFLNIELLRCLATDNECLNTSISNYDNTFKHVEIGNEIKSMDIKVTKGGFFRRRRYKKMFVKLIRIGITYGQIKTITVEIAKKVVCIQPYSLIKQSYRRGCVCLGWLIPSCLVDAAYHSACTNTTVFAQLGIKYIIIGNYKIKPPISACKETPMELFCRYYQNLVQRLQPTKVSDYLFCKGLLNKKDYRMITNAPCDRIKNRMIIEHVRHRSSSYLFTFLDVLQNIEDQRYLYNTLISALQSAGFLYLPDDYDVTLDDIDDEDDEINHSLFHPRVDQYVKSCLKMNLSVKNKMQPLLPDANCSKPKPSDIDVQYLYLIDSLCKLMESCDPGVFIDKCASLMASYIHDIPLFSDETLKDFSEYHNASVMLRCLMCYFSWCDLSVILKLLEICDYPDGVRQLQKFKHQIDFTKPIVMYPTFSPDSLVIPSESSPYTMMVTQYELEHSSLSLKHIEVIKSLLTEKCEITFISCQFLAIANDSNVFYWLIPKNVMSLLMSKIQENYNYLHKNGIKKVYIYPSFTSEFSLHDSDDSHSDVEKIYLQELEKMKLKCNLLHEEIAQLKSQLDTLHKPTIGNLIEKYKKLAEKLKDKEQHDTATIIDLNSANEQSGETQVITDSPGIDQATPAKGINSILISPMSQWKEYICPDCDELMDDPVLTSCGHRMCYKCFRVNKGKTWFFGSPRCPVTDGNGQKHKMSQYRWSKNRAAEQKINELLVKCEKCKMECTVKKYRKFDCSTAHDADAIHSVIVGPASTRLETTTDYSADIDEGRVAQEINNEQWSAAQETNVDAPSELVPSAVVTGYVIKEAGISVHETITDSCEFVPCGHQATD